MGGTGAGTSASAPASEVLPQRGKPADDATSAPSPRGASPEPAPESTIADRPIPHHGGAATPITASEPGADWDLSMCYRAAVNDLGLSVKAYERYLSGTYGCAPADLPNDALMEQARLFRDLKSPASRAALKSAVIAMANRVVKQESAARA